MRVPVGAVALALLGSFAAAPALGHGASRGLHLHVRPDPARPGGRVVVEVNAAEAIEELRVGFAGGEPRVERPKKPSRRASVRLRVPEAPPPGASGGGTAALHAEVRTVGGRILRASAVVRLKKVKKGTFFFSAGRARERSRPECGKEECPLFQS